MAVGVPGMTSNNTAKKIDIVLRNNYERSKVYGLDV
jgi:hypothetical protein